MWRVENQIYFDKMEHMHEFHFRILEEKKQQNWVQIEIVKVLRHRNRNDFGLKALHMVHCWSSGRLIYNLTLIIFQERIFQHFCFVF